MVCRRCGIHVSESHGGVISRCRCVTPLLMGPCSFCGGMTGEGLLTVVSQGGDTSQPGRKHPFAHRKCYNLDILSKEHKAMEKSAAAPGDKALRKSAEILTRMADLVCEHHLKNK